MTDPDRKLRGIKQTPRKTQRASNQEFWVNAPLQNAIRDALAAREWSISDLGRAIGSQPSLVSRWMMGSRPSTSSIIAISRALGLDVKRLLVLAGHLPPDEVEDEDERVTMLKNKLGEIEMTDERFTMLNGLLETMRKTPVMTVETLTEAPEARPPRRRSA